VPAHYCLQHTGCSSWQQLSKESLHTAEHFLASSEHGPNHVLLSPSTLKAPRMLSKATSIRFMHVQHRTQRGWQVSPTRSRARSSCPLESPCRSPRLQRYLLYPQLQGGLPTFTTTGASSTVRATYNWLPHLQFLRSDSFHRFIGTCLHLCLQTSHFPQRKPPHRLQEVP